MENNFDKIFKEKLEHRQFEMKPEFWEGAEALIEADEKTGGWRRLFVWFGIVLLAGLSVFFIWKNENSDQIVKNENLSNTTQENVLGTTLDNTDSEFEISKNNISNENTSATKNQSVGKNESNNSENVLGETVDENGNTISNTSKSKNADYLNNKSSDFSKTIPSEKSENNSSGIKNNNNTPTFISTEKNPLIEEMENAKLDAAETQKEEEELPIMQEGNSAIENKKEEEIVVQPIASTSTILLPFLEMFLANNQKIKKLDLEAVCPFSPPRDKFAFGIFGGAVGYPLVENSTETPFIGFKTGLLLERNFEIKKAKLALGAELAYHYRSGNFEATKQNEVARYSFGRSIAQAKLTPENLHYLEMPLYLKYQNRRMTFETGASFNYLLGVKGKVTEVDGTIQSGWMPSVGFKKNHVNVLLGFHYQISDNLHFGVRANYTPRGILDSTAALPDGIRVALQESKPFYLTFRVTQYLKFKK